METRGGLSALAADREHGLALTERTEMQAEAGGGVSHSNTKEKQCCGGMERSMQCGWGGNGGMS